MGKALLVILDGYGISADPSVSAIDQARKPFLDQLFASHPHGRLTAGGEAVGLPEGQFGNSEVGHLNIGAGRIVWQDLSRIDKSIRDGSFFDLPGLKALAASARKAGRLHLMGLFSDGGVHSHIRHLDALVEWVRRENLQQVYLHLFGDGRDTAPDSGITFARGFDPGPCRIVSLVGRYYAMDRDTRWERVRRAYDLLVHGNGTHADSLEAAFAANYAAGKTDEFLEPVVIGPDADQTRIHPGDPVLFFNYRSDRARELSVALNDPSFSGFPTTPLEPDYHTFTQYDATFAFAKVLYEAIPMANTLGEWVSKQGKTQLRIAETEKYPHVSFFFNGGVEQPNPGEDRILVPSPKVATYDLQPEMSAPEVTDKLIAAIRSKPYDLVVLNYANPDMVGHTGSMEAAVKAIEAVDAGMSRLIPVAREHGYEIVVIADHGNADQMRNPDGTPHTAHTLAPVPVLVVRQGQPTPPREGGILADVAPTLLALMGLPQPPEMTGRSLV